MSTAPLRSAALILTASLSACAGGPGAATATPSAAEADVIAVVEEMFRHMKAGDADAMRALMHPDVRLATTGVRDGRPVVGLVPMDDFLNGIRSSTREADERLWDTRAEVSGGLAMVWTGYSLFVDGVFSHCGVDLFELVRTEQGWRILSVADTRRQEGCPTS